MANYLRWNELLVSYVLEKRRGSGAPVCRIPATPEELCLVSGIPPDEIHALSKDEVDAVVGDFVLAVRAELHTEHASLLSYCLLYKTKHGAWFSPVGPDIPYFFGVLWLTCLVAYGYPSEAGGDFYARFKSVLGHGVTLTPLAQGGLDQVWEDLARWTRETPGYRKLILPPRCSLRTNIGRSHYLAFPHRLDRERLAQLLREAGLIGQEPPVRGVLDVLRQKRDDFSDEFKADLANLFHDFLEAHLDPRDSPFWRAVRQEAKNPSTDPVDTGGTVATSAVLLAEWDDGLLSPYLAFDEATWTPPVAWQATLLDEEISGLTHRLTLGESELVGVLSAPKGILRAFEARCVEQGLVPLVEEVSGSYRVATADAIALADHALVREDLVAEVRAEFGGQVESVGVSGWRLLADTRLEQKNVLRDSLEQLSILMPTTDAPPPRLVSGVRIGNTYLRVDGLPEYLPFVRARGASSVIVRVGDQLVGACEPIGANADLWRLPDAVSQSGQSCFEVEAAYPSQVLEYTFDRTSTCRLLIEEHVLSTAYKGLPSGSFQRECCSRQLLPQTGPSPSVPMDGTSASAATALDTLTLDPTARWLGPGFGEMSLSPAPGFPWLAVGPKKRPDFLLLDVPSPDSIPPPKPIRSPLKGDRYQWHNALTKSKTVAWKRRAEFVALADWPEEAKQALSGYRANRNNGEASVSPTGLETQNHFQHWGVAPVPAAATLVDVIAALSANRSGLSLSELHEHVGRAYQLQETHSLRQHIIRSMEECGFIDVLRRADGRQRVVVARRPRFVAVRRGPAWIATLLGLVPSPMQGQLDKEVHQLGVTPPTVMNSVSGFASPLLRMNALSHDHLDVLTRRLGLDPIEYLEWEDPNELPMAFRIHGELRRTPPPAMYQREATWCWNAQAFRREPGDSGPIAIERRTDNLRTPIYVVIEGDAPLGWSYSRTWALIAAHERLRRSFLGEEGRGVFVSTGASPLHLPVPLGRLCAMLGLGVPGPRVVEGHRRVDGYCYPLGPQLRRLLFPHLPTDWVTA